MGIITMQEVKVGVSFMLDGSPYVALKSEYTKSGRGSAVMHLKIRNLLTGQIQESVYTAADKVEEVDLELRPMQFLYKDGDNYVFMDTENFEQDEVPKEDLGTATNYLVDNMEIELAFYINEEKAIRRAVDVRLPITIERTITHTEPGIKGDTSGRSLKRATIGTGYELMVPLFCEEGSKIRIDTRDGSYIERVK